MKDFLLRLLLAASVMALGFALASSAERQQQPTTTAQSPQQHSVSMPSAGETRMQDAHLFIGRIVKENGDFVLKDPFTKVSYQLDKQLKVGKCVGKQVKVTGELDLNSNKIQVNSIKVLS